MSDRKIALLTDSTCDLTDEELKENDICMIPMQIIYERQEYRDRVDITPQQVYDRLTEEVPHSSLPLPEDVMDCLNGLKGEGYTDVLYISISSGLSGSSQMMRVLAEQYNGLDIHVLDTRTLSMGLGLLVLEAAKTLRDTGDLDAVITRVEKVRNETKAFFVIPTLKYLRMGGRIGTVAAVLGTTLNLKPVITVSEEGKYVTAVKVRGFQHAVAKMEQLIVRHFGRQPIQLAVVHGDACEGAKKLQDRLSETMTLIQSRLRQISPVLGVHTGPGLLGLIAYPST
jgi:DegV family protein with EDD domain